jgi:hypothetical protein
MEGGSSIEPTAHFLHEWVKQTDLDEGRRTDGLTTQEGFTTHRAAA